MTKFLLIANPTSGSQRTPTLASRACELLNRRGFAAELKLTNARGDAAVFAKEAVAKGVGVVVGCGGDGTLQEIASVLDSTPTALGVLPAGRCNDFAHALGLNPFIKGKDETEKVDALVNILAQGHRRQVDLGAVGDKRFLTVATLGFDSEVDRFVAERNLWLKGTPAYIYAALRVLVSYRSPMVFLTSEGGKIESRMLLVATGNTSSYGGAIQITPDAKMDDGRFQLCVIKQVSKFSTLGLLPKILSGRHVSHPAVQMIHSRFLEIQTPENPLWVCADGEPLCQTPCRLEVRPNALTVIAPE